MVPSVIMGNPSQRGETVVLMERSSADSRSYEYDFVNPAAEVAHSALARLQEKGLVPVVLFLHFTYVLILEKAL